MDKYNVIAEQEHTTVMSHYEALPREERGYQLPGLYLKEDGMSLCRCS